MTFNGKKSLILITLAMGFSLFFLTDMVFAKTYTMRLQCVYGEHAAGGINTVNFAKKVEEYTNGAVKVKIFWPGQLAKTKEAYKALAGGMFQGLSAATIYYSGIIPELKVEFLPFNWKSPQDAYDLYQGEFGDILRKAHLKKGVHWAGPYFAGKMLFLTNFPVKTLEDIKGKKIRALSAYADLVKRIGAVPTSLASSEQYMALKRGTIDGTIYTLSSLDDYKYGEVIEYAIFPGIFTPVVSSIFLNEKWYQSLPKDLQEKIDKASEDMTSDSITISNDLDKRGYDFAVKSGVKIIELSEQDANKLREMAALGWENVAVLSPECRKLVDLLKNNMKE